MKKYVLHRSQNNSDTNARAVLPSEVAKIMNFPGVGPYSTQTIAVIELGGSQPVSTVYDYCKKLNIKPPKLYVSSVDGAVEVSDGPDGADGEVALDQLVIAGVMPPEMTLRLITVYAPNTLQGFADAIRYAASLKPTPCAISISWGGPESSYGQSDIMSMEAALQFANSLKIGNYVAAGDNGSSDGVAGLNVDYPGSSVYATSCGGTLLYLNSDGTRKNEIVWGPDDGATGGGVSKLFPGRSVPDVAANADPQSGYIIECDGQQMSVGGTSAVAPLYAALHAILQSHFQEPIGNLNEIFYNLKASAGEVYDVVDGTNGAYQAKPGRDLCTGVGVVNGMAVLNALKLKGLK